MENNPHKPIIYWLLTGCFLIIAMVVIGGITRLTQSGLSIVEWNVVMGTIPPLNNQDWMRLFEQYKTSPQFQFVNFDFSLNDFKSIFWWEYIHRLLGRIIGLVFFIPFILFLIQKRINKNLLKKLLLIFFLGGFQGFLGWYMVKSGLVHIPAVSHYRLAAHLLTAFASLGFTLWVALELLFPHKSFTSNRFSPQLKSITYLLFGTAIVQTIYGAFVAGKKAGLFFNTFPLMGDTWIHESVFAMHPFYKNLIESIGGIQFAHRMLAYLVVLLSGIVLFKASKSKLNPLLKKSYWALGIIVGTQFILGIFTLILAVPITLGVLHQAGALLLFSNLVFVIFQLKKT